MIRYIFPIALLSLLAWARPLASQNNNTKPMQMEMRSSKSATGAVLLRWAPVDFRTMQWGIQHGYKISRSTIKVNNQAVSLGAAMKKVVLADSIKPWSQTAFQNLMSTDTTDWPDLAAAAVYGEGFTILSPQNSSLMEIIDANKEQQNRFGFGLFAAEQSYTVAQAMGLAFIDNTAQANTEYLYLLELKDTTDAVAKRCYLNVNTATTVNLPTPQLSAEGKEKSVVLRWERSNLDQYYSSYVLERLGNNGTSWKRINRSPIISISDNNAAADAFFYVDTFQQNGVNYKYRVSGMTSFGTSGPASNIVQVSGIPSPIDGIDVSAQVHETSNGQMEIKWEVPTEMGVKIAHYDVWRAEDIQSPFQKINGNPLDSIARSFTDPAPNPVNYYKIESTDINGHKHMSPTIMGQPNDQTPPIAPQTPECSCDKNGKVHISWAASPSSDVMGYRVFMSNNSNPNDMQQITPDWIKETQYDHTITMNTLSEQVFFTVKAIDFRENSSALSPPCAAKRPDVNPPAAPVIKDFQLIGDDVRFTFIPSSSADVNYYNLERRVKNYVNWDLITSIPAAEIGNAFTDTTTFNRWRYEYRLVAHDAAQLVSASRIVEVKPNDDGMRKPIQNLQAFSLGLQPPYPAAPKAVLLTWDYPAVTDKDLMGFQIMRAVGGDTPYNLSFLTIGSAKFSGLTIPDPTISVQAMCGFVDFDVTDFLKLIQQGAVKPVTAASPAITPGPKGVGVRYTVYAKYIDGAMSPLSSVVVVW